MTPQLKLLLRQKQRELFKNGKSDRFKYLKNKFRRQKRKSVKSFYANFVEELKESNPSKWFQMLKKLGGAEQRIKEKLVMESLRGLNDRETVQAVA